MNDLPRQKLCQIVAIYGDALYEDDRRTEGLLRDFCGEYKREIHVLVSAVKEKVATDLLSSQHSLPVEVLLPRLTRRLMENRAIAEPAAQWAVETWALALGIISGDDCSEISETDNEKAAAIRPVSPSEVVPTLPGGALTSLAAQSLISEPAPYTLQPGLSIASFEELPDACERAWERAVDHFVRGYFTEWIELWLVPLRARGRYDYVGGLEPLVREVRSTHAEVAQGDDTVRGAALEDFLAAIGKISGRHIPPELSLMEDQIDLGVVKQGDMAIGRFTLTNATRGFLHGRIVSKVPGPLIDPSHFGCRCGEEVKVEVLADTAGLKGSPQGIEHSALLSIISNGGRKNVTIRVTVGVPALSVRPPELDFGSIVFSTLGVENIYITNSGIGELVGKLQGSQFWLTSGDASFVCSPGETVSVEITADTRLLQGQPGALGSHQAELVFSSNGGEMNVPARVAIAPALVVHPGSLDSSKVAIGSSSDQTLQIANSGIGQLIGEIRVDRPWLSIDDADFHCRPGETILRKITVDAGNLPLGDYSASIDISSNWGNKHVPWKVSVVPALEVSPKGFHFDLTSIEQSLKIRNLSDGILCISLRSGSRWLSIDADTLELNGNQSVDVVVRADFGFLGAACDESEFTVSAGNTVERIKVKADGRSIPPPRSRFGWELRCSDGGRHHTQSEAELRALIAQGCWINNNLPRRPIADLTPDERLHGVVKERKVQGAVMDIGAEVDGLLHISQFRVAPGSSLRDMLQEGDSAIVGIAEKKQGKVLLTMLEPA